MHQEVSTINEIRKHWGRLLKKEANHYFIFLMRPGSRVMELKWLLDKGCCLQEWSLTDSTSTVTSVALRI